MLMLDWDDGRIGNWIVVGPSEGLFIRSSHWKQEKFGKA